MPNKFDSESMKPVVSFIRNSTYLKISNIKLDIVLIHTKISKTINLAKHIVHHTYNSDYNIFYTNVIEKLKWGKMTCIGKQLSEIHSQLAISHTIMKRPENMLDNLHMPYTVNSGYKRDKHLSKAKLARFFRILKLIQTQIAQRVHTSSQEVSPGLSLRLVQAANYSG